jgi:hypothetical protein
LFDVGLPTGDIPVALLAFNGGVELGQLLVIANVLGFLLIASRMQMPAIAQNRLRTASAYAVGITAAFWLIDRIAGFWT